MRLIVLYFQWLFNLALVILGILLMILLCKLLFTIGVGILLNTVSVHETLQNVLLFFLCFALVSTIPKYFKEGYHFPTRNLLYIGITATVRFIVINNQNALHNLFLSLVIFVLLLAYIILHTHEIKYDRGASNDETGEKPL